METWSPADSEELAEQTGPALCFKQHNQEHQARRFCLCLPYYSGIQQRTADYKVGWHLQKQRQENFKLQIYTESSLFFT